MNKQLDILINDFLQKNRDNFINDLRGLIAINSVSSKAVNDKPFGIEPAKAIDYMMNLCTAASLESVNYDYYCMDASYGTGKEIVGALCHLDIVPAGEGWDYPPFAGVMEGSLMYGRGVCDDKGPAIAVFYALKALMNANIKLDRKIRLIFGSDEETGMSDMKYYLTKAKAPDYAFSPDASFPAIFAEKHVMGGTYISEIIKDTCLISLAGGTVSNAVPSKATAKIRYTTLPKSTDKVSYHLDNDNILSITATGVATHASQPQKGENAIIILANALYSLLRESDGAKPLIKSIIDNLSSSDGSAMQIACADETTGELTMNLGLISLSNKKISLVIDIRHPVTLNYKQTIKTLETALRKFTLVASSCSEGIHREKDGFLVSTLQSIYKEITNDIDSVPISIGGGTYARCLPNAVAFGPEFPNGHAGGVHTANEYINIDELIEAARIYAHCLYSLAT